MAKHRKPKKDGARRAVLAGAVATGLSSVMVLGQMTDTTAHHDVALVVTVIGVGGRDDPTSTRLQKKLNGDYALGFVDPSPVLIEYPASLLFQSSIDVGIPRLAAAVDDTTGKTRIVSYSEGTLVAEQVKRNLANPKPGDPAPPSPGDLDFVFIASPYLPNGGIFARFPGFAIPGLLPTFSAAQPTDYDSTYVTNEYDGFADFPAYFNPVSLANALLGMVYAHPDRYYDGIALDDLVEGQTKFTTVVPHGPQGKDTYILVHNPNLPLLAPIRQIASLLMLTPVTEPVLGAVEPLIRLVVDMGYTDRTNANPSTPTGFSFVTPPAKFAEAANAVAGAVRQGASNALPNATSTPNGPASNMGGPDESSPDELNRAQRLSTTGSNVSGESSTRPSMANVPTSVEQEDRTRITHPTLVADGNMTRPGTTTTTTTSATPNDNDAPIDVSSPVIATQPDSTPSEPTSATGSLAHDESAAA